STMKIASGVAAARCAIRSQTPLLLIMFVPLMCMLPAERSFGLAHTTAGVAVSLLLAANQVLRHGSMRAIPSTARIA
nr:hypothetical protein [Acidimicrobiia bacterium]